MTNTEGVTAEEVTADESVTTPEQETPKEPEAQEEEPSNDDAPEEPEVSELDKRYQEDEEFKAFVDKKNAEAVKAKESNRKMALKHKDETIVQKNQIIAELEAKLSEFKDLDAGDFDTDAEFEKAKLKQELKQDELQEKLDDEKAAKQAEEAEMLQIAGDNFREKEEAFIKENPNYQENVGKVQSYLDMLPKENGVIQDQGAQAGMKYILTESDNGAQILNYLGANPDKFDALLGKPPAWIVNKLKAYDKELSTPKEIKSDPLPKPLSKTKGAAVPQKDPNKMSQKEWLKWRNEQVAKKG